MRKLQSLHQPILVSAIAVSAEDRETEWRGERGTAPGSGSLFSQNCSSVPLDCQGFLVTRFSETGSVIAMETRKIVGGTRGPFYTIGRFSFLAADTLTRRT